MPTTWRKPSSPVPSACTTTTAPAVNAKAATCSRKAPIPIPRTTLNPAKSKDIRDLGDTLQNTPAIGALRVTYLGAIDNYNPYALNALLKTLEETAAAQPLYPECHQPPRRQSDHPQP